MWLKWKKKHRALSKIDFKRAYNSIRTYVESNSDWSKNEEMDYVVCNFNSNIHISKWHPYSAILIAKRYQIRRSHFILFIHYYQQKMALNYLIFCNNNNNQATIFLNFGNQVLYVLRKHNIRPFPTNYDHFTLRSPSSLTSLPLTPLKHHNHIHP